MLMVLALACGGPDALPSAEPPEGGAAAVSARASEQASPFTDKAQEKAKEAHAAGQWEWIALPGGRFWMGCEPGQEDCRELELPGREATVAPFEMMKTEVTLGAYNSCVFAGACDPPVTYEQCNYVRPERTEHPMNCVHWHEANTFCAWAGGRLPTDAEWEFAAKGGTARIHPWGNEPTNCERANVMGCGGDSKPVGTHPAGISVHGLHDLAGNVWEWTEQSDQPERGGLRGGSFATVPLGASFRLSEGKQYRPRNYGLRCVRDAVPAAP